MLSPWHWISSVCRQKRILLVLCAFGSSFLLLNYSLLSSQASVSVSSSTTNTYPRILAPSPNVNEGDRSKSANQPHNNDGAAATIIQAKKEQMHSTNLSKVREAQKRKMTFESHVGQSEKSSLSTIELVNNIHNQEKVDKTSHFSDGINPKTDKSEIMIGFRLASPSLPSSETIMTSSGRSAFKASEKPTRPELKSNVLTNQDLPSYSELTPSSSPIYEGVQKPSFDYHSSRKADFDQSFRQQTAFSGDLLSPFHIPPCISTNHIRRVQKRKKNLAVIENFIAGWRRVKCNESITYTTHGDYRYLDNLVPLVERWDGPISLAVYAPGTDLEESIKIISYLKLCTTPKIDEWVMFHLIYDIKFAKRPVMSYVKGDILWLDEVYRNVKWKNCSEKPSFSKGDYTFRMKNGLLYPINIARNIARAAATTHFVLASDIELYPSINLIPSFMEMLRKLQREEEERVSNYERVKNRLTAAAIALMEKVFSGGSSSTKNDGELDGNKTMEVSPSPSTLLSDKFPKFTISKDQHGQIISRHVFVLPVFEVKKEIVPCQVETKEQLTHLLKSRNAVLFHHSICPQCHTFPKFEEWKSSVSHTNLQSNSSASKTGKIDHCNKESSNRSGNNISRNDKVVQQPSSKLQTMRIFHKAKRRYPYQLWEPIFIGTKFEPIYDERLSWEGLRDKMVSGYVMCALDYDFYILDNAFLVHKPGIRKVVHLVTKTVQSQDRLINFRIRAELLKKFGKRDECVL